MGITPVAKMGETLSLMNTRLKQLVKKFFQRFNLDISRKKPHHAPQIPRASMGQCLECAIRNGLVVHAVIDVGAAYGTWPLYQAFPNAFHLLIEPVEEFYPALRGVVARLPHAELICAAATRRSERLTIHVHPDLIRSSCYEEDEDSDVNGIERIVQGITLDELCQQQKLAGPYLMKIDTQGAELDVLSGAEKTLLDAEMVILEVSCFQFFKGGPQFYECIQFMNAHGFVVYDIFDLQYRLFDGAMSQVDIAFVKENSRLRASHCYATAEQRRQQNQRFQKRHG
ncbi:methyltransferase FkbM [Candidatus Moduliflexus flocculans]|uniref:Methyltransferase FkbM n=1 Tax=Candidatus Moduliflexus flocculans TaxID=1499966 RepID=A0A0S6VSV8_9BACT|nr:methyltransferase FkbM [Candidatus Moduliflexus flocculans]